MTPIITTALFIINWTFNPIVWEAEDVGLVATSHANEFAIYKTSSLYKRVTVSADVKIEASLGNEWKMAGVSVYQNNENFWHFALVASPDNEEKRFFELSEMRDGTWLAQSNLKQVAHVPSDGTWKPGETYRLTTVLDENGVEGTATDATGKVLCQIKYQFTDTAVDCGKPALHCSGFKATFHQIETKTEQPVVAKKRAFPPYMSKSFFPEVGGEKTGFFRVEKQGDQWFAIDPAGRGFLPLGVDHVCFEVHYCESLGYAPYHKKNLEKYPNREAWEVETLDRLEKWGFNMIAAGGSPSLYRRGFTHAVNLDIGESFTRLGEEYEICEAKGIPCSAFPNVFHPDFEAFCDYQAMRCQANADDPWLFGYFLDNELRWWGEGSWDRLTGLFSTCMMKKPSHTAKIALVDFFRERYHNDIQKFNEAWKTTCQSFDDLFALETLEAPTDCAIEDQATFVEKIAERYFKVTCGAIRKYDPKHMILGCRLASGNASKEVWRQAGKYCDVISFNYYGNVNLDHGVAMNDGSPWTGKTLREVFDHFYEMGQKPMIVTEWAFPALDAGLPSVHGAGQRFRTQAERTEATRIFAETMLRMPYMIGYDYFMWVDEPALGISEKFPEDSNYGLVNEDGKPYAQITEMFTELHRNAARLKKEGFAQPPIETPLKAKKVTGTMKPEPIQFLQDGDRYQVISGKWKLEGMLGEGPFWSNVAFGDGQDTRLGWFSGLVEHGTIRLNWDEVNRVIQVTPVVDPKTNAMVAVDLVGRCEKESGPVFEMTQRFSFYPNEDTFAIEMLWCKNLSKAPLVVKHFYFRPHSDIGGDGKNDTPIKEKVAPPRVWGSPLGDAWFDTPRKTYWGLATLPDMPAVFYFWFNEQGGQHPDARWKADIAIQPGETYRPLTPIKVLSIAGQGNRIDWEQKTQETLKNITW